MPHFRTSPPIVVLWLDDGIWEATPITGADPDGMLDTAANDPGAAGSRGYAALLIANWGEGVSPENLTGSTGPDFRVCCTGCVRATEGGLTVFCAVIVEWIVCFSTLASRD